MLIVKTRHVTIPIDYRHFSRNETNVGNAGVGMPRPLSWAFKHFSVHRGYGVSANENRAAA